MFYMPWELQGHPMFEMPTTSTYFCPEFRRAQPTPHEHPKPSRRTKSELLQPTIQPDGQATAVIHLPEGTRPENVDIDLNEKLRTLTLRVNNNSWRRKLKLDNSFDLNRLDADFDVQSSELRLRSPFLGNVVKQTFYDEDIGYASESSQAMSDGSCSQMEEDGPSTSSKTELRRPMVTIEDVGPEEYIDFR